LQERWPDGKLDCQLDPYQVQEIGNRALEATRLVLDTVLLNYMRYIDYWTHCRYIKPYHEKCRGQDLPYEPAGWDFGQVLFVLRNFLVRERFRAGGLLVEFIFEEEEAAIGDLKDLNEFNNQWKHRRDTVTSRYAWEVGFQGWQCFIL